MTPKARVVELSTTGSRAGARPRASGIILFVTVLLLPVVLGFSSAANGITGGDLEKIRWQLAEYFVDGTLKDVATAGNFDAEFRDGRVSGQAVNSYSGSYRRASGGGLTIGKLSSTLMAGPPELQAVETVYFASLQRTASYTSDGSTLRLYDADGVEILVFSRSEGALVGSWTVTGYNDGKNGVVSVISKSTITMEFAESGAVTGNAGVNQYSAEYRTSGTAGLEIGPVATTRKAGPVDLMEQERQFLAALSAAKTYRRRGDVVELRDTSGSLQVTAASGQ